MAADNGGVVASNRSGIDAFLAEGLENPRDRLTILRLEEEVLRFMENSKQEQLELQPMVSSYARLAAHHVAEHYRLKSLLVDTREGPKIVLTKTADTKVPSTRLRDVPVKMPGILLPPLSPPKLAIKRRPTSSCFAPADVTNVNRKEVKLPSARSVEERKEEYNRARARIFSEDGADSNPSRMCCPRILKLDSNLLEEIKRDLVKAKEGGDEASKDGKSRESQSSTKVKPNHRVAIFRDREKDKRDPDYDRSYDRYHHRVEANSYGLGIVAPQVIYNTHFHQHVHVPPQAVQGPWMNPMSYAPEATYTHQTILMQAPQVGGYHGSYAGEASQHYYQQFSQQPQYVQPEVSYIQPRRF